ncbi:hypothetical protein Taro_012116 [Colocasia esculenta]|uniref:Uncharacterized protein n=1 Tax=Colocasia esculenta TaxID=4460 RepID=A0A843UCR2_COLES|nr:hypothetical protein [Colocasia esculenta]
MVVVGLSPSLLVLAGVGFPRTVLCLFLVAVALPSKLRCVAWLPCVLVRFLRTICCCPSEGFSQDCFALVSTVAELRQSLRCAVGLAGAFWRVFLERCLGGSGGGSPRTCLRCFCSSIGCSVLSDGLCCLVVGLCILVKVLLRIALCRFYWRFFPGVLCMSCRCCRVDCLCYSLLGRCQSRHCALGCASSCCVGQLASLFISEFLGCAGGTSCVPMARMVCFVSRTLRALPDGGLVSAVGVWLTVLLVEASVLRWGFPSCMLKRLVICVSFLCFPLVARGGDTPVWCCVARVRIIATFWWSHLPLSCFWVELVAPLVLSFSCDTVGQWIYSCCLS